MTKVMTFARVYPKYHPRKGEPTNFVEKIWESIGFDPINKISDHYRLLESPFNDDKEGLVTLSLLRNIDISLPFYPKGHTIRAGHRWKAGDWFKPVVWSGLPYKSKQIQLAPDMQVKKTWDFVIESDGFTLINDSGFLHTPIRDLDHIGHEHIPSHWTDLAANDGLSIIDLWDWFKYPSAFDGQIICWDDTIQY